ncbi:MAG: MFS transporter [bacterium]
MKKYLFFIYDQKKSLAFGFFFALLSCFGQTFLISLFKPNFLAEFKLTNSSFGLIYSLATFSSSVILPYLGSLIDRYSLKKFSFYVIIGLILAPIIISTSANFYVLFLGLFLLRLTGQGLSDHTAYTSMARHYSQKRGIALSITSMGRAVGEGFLPLAITQLLNIAPWRLTWLLIAGVVLFSLFFIQLIIRISSLDSTSPEDQNHTDNDNQVRKSKDISFKEIILDLKFWLLAPAVTLPPFLVTGLFLYQVNVARQLSWSIELLAGAFTVYAGFRVFSALGSGPMIDRWSARRLFPLYLLPMSGGLIFAYFHPGSWAAFAYMSLLGVTLGMGKNLKSALWAEIYGVEYLGTVRSLYASLVIFSTSVSPFLMGWLLDAGVAITTILIGSLTIALVATIGAFVGVQVD